MWKAFEADMDSFLAMDPNTKQMFPGKQYYKNKE